MSLALQVPEILLHTLSFLEDDRLSLATAIRVSKPWFACGIAFLWSQPPAKALAAIAPKRRQIYAFRIITFEAQSHLHMSFKDLLFSNLERISLRYLHRTTDGSSDFFNQYFQPRLKELSIRDGIDQGLLDALAISSPRLQTIRVDFTKAAGDITPSSFLAWLSKCPSLEHMEYRIPRTEIILNPDLMLHLAGRDNLKVLQVYPNQPWTNPVCADIITKVSEPFRALEEINASILSITVPLLVPWFSRVRCLALDISDDECDVLEPLSALTELRSLCLLFSSSVPIRLQEIKLLSLMRLSKLCSLTIQGNTLSAPGFSQVNFNELIAHFPQLRHLTFRFVCSLAADALESLSKHCPYLTTCELLSTFDLRTLRLESRSEKEIMFPSLEKLIIADLEEPGPRDPYPRQ